MGVLIHLIISIIIVYGWFTVAYLLGRKDDEGKPVYQKEQGIYSLVTILLIYFIVNFPKIIGLLS